MRKCKNCSYKLMPQDGNQCPQCGSTEIDDPQIIPNPTISSLKSPDEQMKTTKGSDFIQDQSVNKTIVGKQESTIHSDNASRINCPECGYPVNNLANNCPNCKKEMIAPVATKLDLSHNRTQSLSDIISLGIKDDKFIVELEPLDKDDAAIKFKIGDTGKKVLRREDIDMEDETLSQVSHVGFYINDKKLMIENLASNQAVFKMVNNTDDLKNGDVIILGRNKFFRVKIK
ncbi:MAG: hypothetical protein IPO62_04610 [Saprospiraceae bacterium]|nr:hypothetical protein [Saprospiraceae bacterium]